jgi:hypothetical protein
MFDVYEVICMHICMYCGVFDVFEVICMHVCMYLMCLKLYACIWCVSGYIYAYMCISNFEIQGIKEK